MTRSVCRLTDRSVCLSAIPVSQQLQLTVHLVSLLCYTLSCIVIIIVDIRDIMISQTVAPCMASMCLRFSNLCSVNFIVIVFFKLRKRSFDNVHRKEFSGRKGERVKSYKPPEAQQSADPFDSQSTHRADYVRWKTKKPYKHVDLYQPPDGCMETTTTSRLVFQPPKLPKPKRLKPLLPPRVSTTMLLETMETMRAMMEISNFFLNSFKIMSLEGRAISLGHFRQMIVIRLSWVIDAK